MNNAKPIIEGLVITANWINSLILTGISTSILVIVTSFFGKKEFKIKDLHIPVAYFPLFVVCLTIGHAYLTWLFVRKCTQILKLGATEAINAWISLVNKGGLLFSEMEKRTLQHNIGPFDQSAYVFTAFDPAAWLSLSFAITLLVAVAAALWHIQFISMSRFQSFCVMLLLGSILSSINWVIGSQWAISASNLAP